MRGRMVLKSSLALAILTVVPACGGGGDDSGPPTPATVSTLAYVVTECRTDATGRGTMRQTLQIRRGEQAPITVVEHSTSGFINARALCDDAGRNRQGTRFSRWGVFHRLGVTPDGSQVVFEVTDQQAPTVFPANFLSAEQKGFFAVRADGSGLRRLGPASREPPYGGGFLYTWVFLASSPNSRMVTYTDRGPGLGDQDAIQIFALDLVTGEARQVTRLPSAPRAASTCGPTGCPFFSDDETITFVTTANVDGTNPNGQNISVTVRTDGTGLTVSPPIAAIPGSTLLTSFQITGSQVIPAWLTLPGMPVNGTPSDTIKEVFVSDGDNILQLTNFGRLDTFNPTLSADGQRVFFSASANPPELGTNPTENCQIFSIDRTGGDLQQLTNFSEGPHSTTGCLFGPPPFGCPAFLLGLDSHTGALVIYSSCDPFGTNPFGSQVFAMHPDGTGLRQLTKTQPYTVDAGGAVTVELPFPIAHPGTTH